MTLANETQAMNDGGCFLYRSPAPAISSSRRQHRLVAGSMLLLTLLAVGIVGCNSNSEDQSENTGPSQAEIDRAKLLAEAELDEDRQREIWEAENVTFALERRFGRVWMNAIKEGDQERLASFFVPDAKTLRTNAEPKTKEQADVTETKQRSHDSSDLQSITVKKLTQSFVSEAEEFQEITWSSIRVLHLVRTTPDEPTWEAEVLIELRGDSYDGMPLRKKWIQHVVLDFNEGDRLDETAAIKSWSVVESLRSFGNQYLFREVTEDVDLHDLGLIDNWLVDVDQTEQYRFQYAVEDFDADGYLDIALAPMGGAPMLLRQYRNGKFRQVSFERGIHVGLPLENFCCCWIDVDGDGASDLIMGDRLYRNTDGFFEDITQASGLNIDPFCMGAIVADYDLDGDLDLYVLYQVELDEVGSQLSQWVDERLTGKANRLWQNDGTGKFVDVTAQTNSGGGGRHTHAAAWFHLDDDLYPDLYIANDFGKNVVLRNKGDGSFEDVTEPTQAGGYSTSMGVATGDMDNDGQNEVYVANMFSKMGRRIIAYVSNDDYPEGIYDQIVGSCAGNQLFRKTAEGSSFDEISEASGVNGVGWAFAPALADFDNDGLLDIYATTGFMSFERSKPDG